jgi:hypothetical protein
VEPKRQHRTAFDRPGALPGTLLGLATGDLILHDNTKVLGSIGASALVIAFAAVGVYAAVRMSREACVQVDRYLPSGKWPLVVYGAAALILLAVTFLPVPEPLGYVAIIAVILAATWGGGRWRQAWYERSPEFAPVQEHYRKHPEQLRIGTWFALGFLGVLVAIAVGVWLLTALFR